MDESESESSGDQEENLNLGTDFVYFDDVYFRGKSDSDAEISLDNVEDITEFLSCLDKPEKFYVFQEIVKGRTLTEIGEDSGVATSTVHKYVERLTAADLIEKEAMGKSGYKMTFKGYQVLNMLISLDHLLSVEKSPDFDMEDIEMSFNSLRVNIEDSI